MDLFLKILAIIGIVLLVIIALVILFLVLPIYYDFDGGTNNKSTYYDVKIKSLLNIVIIEAINDLVLLRLFGFIKIKLSSNNKKDNKDSSEYDMVDDSLTVSDDSSFFRKLKKKVYIFEGKIKEKAYKFRRTVNDISEYKYKMELLKKTVDFVQKILKLLKPKKSNMCVEFGCGNPEITGKLVGYLSSLQVKYPNLMIMPNFDKATLSFNVTAKGYVMPVKALVIFLKFVKEDSVKELIALRKERKHA